MKIYKIEAIGDDWIDEHYFASKEKASEELKQHSSTKVSVYVTDFDTEPVEDQILRAWHQQAEWTQVAIKTEITIED
tara:strand:- start:837 stop:1067 length:231 start_codon:yes stop_codon:yes gene_type:complete